MAHVKRILAMSIVFCTLLTTPTFATENSTLTNISQTTNEYVAKQIADAVLQNPKSVVTEECILEIKSPEGNVLQLPTKKLETLSGNTYTNTYAVEVTSADFDKITSGSQSNSESDGVLVTAHITIEYNKRTTDGYPDEYLLTKVYGSWSINHQVELIDQYVVYACYDLGGGERVEKYPYGNAFSYDTGFTYYARDVATSIVAARSETTILRGLSSEWDLSVSATLINNGLEI